VWSARLGTGRDTMLPRPPLGRLDIDDLPRPPWGFSCVPSMIDSLAVEVLYPA
jgi:hypothetical protein